MLNVNIGDTVHWYVPTTCPCGNAFTHLRREVPRCRTIVRQRRG